VSRPTPNQAIPNLCQPGGVASRIDPKDLRWYQGAVFYEVLVRGFYDANDGNGDLRRLTQKLDYLEWLGVDCLWLLPFYQSPLRDGGYDISDFLTVHPDFGDLDDAVELIEEAHRAASGSSPTWS
jgi:maltose alpha-D-glucosyltransferase / alpha-amylase